MELWLRWESCRNTPLVGVCKRCFALEDTRRTGAERMGIEASLPSYCPDELRAELCLDKEGLVKEAPWDEFFLKGNPLDEFDELCRVS